MASNDQKKTRKSRKRTLKLAAINIAMHPHSPSDYVTMLGRAREQRTTGLLGRDRTARVGSLKLLDNGPLYKGHISSWVGLDTTKPWINTDTDDAADPALVKGLEVPKNLQPGYERVDFYFDSVKHRFVVEDGRPFSVKSIAIALNAILNQPIVNRGVRVEVTVVQDQDSLDRIWALPHLRRLEIVVARPNGDSHEELEEEVRKALEAQHVRKQRIVMFGDSQGLKPNEQTKATARIALSNGGVNAVGKDSTGKRTAESTLDHPLIYSEQHDPDTEAREVAFRRMALDFLESMDKRPPE